MRSALSSRTQQSSGRPAPRILIVPAGAKAGAVLQTAKRLGFSHLMLPPDLAELRQGAHEASLHVHIAADPEASPPGGWEGPLDPRTPLAPPHLRREASDDPSRALLVDTSPQAAWPGAAERIRRLRLCAIRRGGIAVPLGYAVLDDEGDTAAVEAAILGVNTLLGDGATWQGGGEVRRLSGTGEPIEIWRRLDTPAPCSASRAVFALVNRNETHPVPLAAALRTRIAGDFAALSSLTGAMDPWSPLDPGEARLVLALRRPIGRIAMPENAQRAAQRSRVSIANVAPSVDQGAYAAKRVVGDMLSVEADIFTDGHEEIGADLLFKVGETGTWSRSPMRLRENDRWGAAIALEEIGEAFFRVEAWLDQWGTFASDLRKKRDAGLDLGLEMREGLALIASAQERVRGKARHDLDSVLQKAGSGDSGAVDAMLSHEARIAMAAASAKPSLVQSYIQRVQVERTAARFASWYELFPRSMTADPARPGTLRDVIDHLPRIASMGFDVLYFPPIHPIGRTNRKGKNNSLSAGPGEPGSPYAIGSPEGGHDAIHPELGTLADFQALRRAADEYGIELALDFAIQASPDHPWLKQHPDWFAWRPDGSIRYAENPPKKYQDIVNVDFYAAGAVPDLWLALRDVILHWIEQGVRTFRVDNPHTKPLPFWEWMIADVRGRHPDTIFLSEAFTRPKRMYHLAKIGFSQSYTYFTWRHSKQELTEYLTELTTEAPREFFRPHFFVNTPDINPYFLQNSGRPGFLIRAALAATLSGLWGVYSGFELCEAAALPGKEEYLDSEKFEIKLRDWNAPGNIIAEITRLNRIRRTEPALQSHLGVRFYNAFNERILYFGKRAPGERGMVLVAISLDPFQTQEAPFEIPLWEYGLADDGAVNVIDLLTDARFLWRGKIQNMRLTPDAPYRVWRIQPVEV